MPKSVSHPSLRFLHRLAAVPRNILQPASAASCRRSGPCQSAEKRGSYPGSPTSGPPSRLSSGRGAGACRATFSRTRFLRFSPGFQGQYSRGHHIPRNIFPLAIPSGLVWSWLPRTTGSASRVRVPLLVSHTSCYHMVHMYTREVQRSSEDDRSPAAGLGDAEPGPAWSGSRDGPTSEGR